VDLGLLVALCASVHSKTDSSNMRIPVLQLKPHLSYKVNYVTENKVKHYL